MNEQRFVVEITRPVPADAVAEVSAEIARRLDMEPQRIVTLLSERVGAVTKAVLPDKAKAIADVFRAAGVRVVVLPAPETAPVPEPGTAPVPEPGTAPEQAPGTTPEPRPQTAPEPGLGTAPGLAREPSPSPSHEQEAETWRSDEPERHGVGDPYPDDPEQREAEEAQSDDLEPSAVEETQSADTDERHFGSRDVAEPNVIRWDATHAWAVDEPADWGRLSQRSTEPGPEAQEDEPHPGAAEPQADVREVEAPDEREPDREEAPAAGAAGEAAQAPHDLPPWRFEATDPELEDEADQLGPRVPPREPSPFSTSTRWVPSPHDEYGFDGDEVPQVATAPDLEEQWNDARSTSAGRGFRPQAGAWIDDGHAAEPPHEGPRLRVYLMWSLIVSIVVFLLLQFVMADRARSGPPASDFAAGLAAFRNGEFAAAMRAWEPEAASGNPVAQYYLGYMAQNGLGQPWSNARAASYYRDAATAGLPEAQLALGDLYLRGMGVEQDATRGAALYAMAASSGDARARYEYGNLLLHGRGVARDPALALAQFEAAAAGGLAEAADLVAFAREAADSQPGVPAATP